MQIFVKTLTGKTITVVTNRNITARNRRMFTIGLKSSFFLHALNGTIFVYRTQRLRTVFYNLVV